MKAVVYKGNGQIALEERPVPEIIDDRDAIVQVTLTTICSSDIHIKQCRGQFRERYWGMSS